MKKNYLFLLGLTIPLFTNGQEALSSSGGNAKGSGGSVSYTVGQVAYSSNTGNSGTITQGVQQPFEILVITGIDEAKGISIECSVFPNPTSDFVKLKVESYKIENLSFQLYDINGNILQNKILEGNEIQIFMSNLVPATYFLKVKDQNQEIKTFKIIKK